ncbi:dTMP kinase [Paraglaciecola sp. MB-3u-78]|uniref:dTMP kinase n=1 Tax=Paraglaciecola sp. MB-3u-78 TaxID=2058332 RepID=UPI000C326907|nr:dTMP kinase [Paraglaciecola sp. MB-3u-78]PKG99451.1 dTMP kinase [Paraglaciecola sp. MB-3u-78]
MHISGKFIVIEGLEGAGKSSAVAILTQSIQAAGHIVINTREPGGTAMAEAIRDVVKHDWHDEKVTVEAELLLMYAARAQLVQNVILPNLEKGHWVLGDRHDMSSQAYQGGGRQIDQSMIENLRAITLKDFRPDFTLYMDVEPKEGLKRAKGRGELDRIEQEDVSFFERTRERYLLLAQQDKNCVVINTMQSIKAVHNDVELAINQFLES